MNIALIRSAVAAVVGLSLIAEAQAKPELIFHLDFNTCVMNRKTVLGLLDHVAKQGYTAILWEIENAVRFECAPEIASPDACSQVEFREVLAHAKSLGLEPIPLMQTIGHGEYVLDHDEYRHLRENPKEKDCYCPSKPATLAFLKALLHEYLEIFGPDVKRFHLGGDEVYSFRTCTTCKQRPEVELYVSHLEAVAEELRAKGIRPGVWHDMLRHFDQTGGAFAKLPKDFTLWYWEYFYPRGQDWAIGAEEGVRREIRAGREVFFCSAIQCHQDDPFMVRYGQHRGNVDGTVDVCRKEGMSGYCVTSWMCHQGPKELQKPLIDFAAKRYLKPGMSAETDWQDIVRRYYGDVSVDLLDQLTAWHYECRYFDGRCWTKFKDGVAPERGYFAKYWGERTSGALHNASFARCLAGGVREGADKLVRVPQEKRGPLVPLLLEAAALKADYLEMAADGMLGHKIRPIPYECARRFYSREMCPRSVERALRRIYQGYEKE